ncbi:hypothetical protein LCGC14_1255630 [marine sediment metagenome]|uniref:Uncharacterized protein n=1 Tax=marine sediment metagenome TaxID=412755 RepID=A0A0F9NIU3_9ZZZZ
MSEEIEQLANEVKRLQVIVDTLHICVPFSLDEMSNEMSKESYYETTEESHEAQLELMSKGEIIEEASSYRKMFLGLFGDAWRNVRPEREKGEET